MDDEYKEEYDRIAREEADEDIAAGYVPDDGTHRKAGFSQVVIIIYLLIHLAYTVYMFTENWMHALLWLFILLVETAAFSVVLQIRNKAYFFGRLLAAVFALRLVANTGYSVFILASANDKGTSGADYALVMGFGLNDNEMDIILQLRCDRAMQYLQDNPDCKAVLCGGLTRGNTRSEAGAMYDYMTSKGISADRLILEDGSTSTATNISNAFNLIPYDSHAVIITSNYHLKRAKEICRKNGRIIKGVPADTPVLLLPDKLLWEKIKLVVLLMDL